MWDPSFLHQQQIGTVRENQVCRPKVSFLPVPERQEHSGEPSQEGPSQKIRVIVRRRGQEPPLVQGGQLGIFIQKEVRCSIRSRDQNRA